MSGRDTAHRLVWMNRIDDLKEYLSGDEGKEAIDQYDVRGNTALHLAIMLGRKEAAIALLEAGANTTKKNKLGWYPLHEARSLGDRELIKSIIRHRRSHMQKYLKTRSEATIEKLKEIDDFYMEMQWDFSSWIPFVSRFCPSDTNKIWKRGSDFRVDTSLRGFENLKWIRGNVTFLFKSHIGDLGTLYILDHEKKIYEIVTPEEDESKLEETINIMMNTKIRYAELKTEKLSFVKSKSGPLGIGSTKTEMVGQYEAEIFNLSNLKVKSITRSTNQKIQDDNKINEKIIITQSRSEHMNVAREKNKDDLTKVEEILENDYEGKEDEVLEKVKKFEVGAKDSDLDKMLNDAKNAVLKYRESLPPPSPPSTTFEDYFYPELKPVAEKKGGLWKSFSSGSLTDQEKDPETMYVGREMSITDMSRTFKATLWMSTSFPLFIEQFLPVIEILAPSSKHFSALKDFIDLKLPRGFPVKIEIPLFGVLTAKVTFQNFRLINENLDDLFQIPSDYVQGEVKLSQST